MSGGMSWMASLMATLLKPQLRHSPIVAAMASASSGREEGALLDTGDDAFGVRGSALPAAVRAEADDLDQRALGRKSSRARRRLEGCRDRSGRPLADRAAAFANEKDDEVA